MLSKILHYTVLINCFLFAPFHSIHADWQSQLKLKIEQNNPPLWMLEQIAEDLISFSESGISQAMLDETMNQDDGNFANAFLLIRYEIIDNKVLIKSDISKIKKQPHIEYRLNIITEALIALSANAQLPNLDFIITLHDAATGIERSKFISPIFSFAKDKNTDLKVVLFPDYDALAGNYGVLEHVKKGNDSYAWEKKKNRAFWRGAMTGGIYTTDNFLTYPRAKLITWSLNFPKLVDAKFHVLCQAENPEEIRNCFSSYFGNSLPVSDHMKYKYQILIDGNTCAYNRAFWQLFSNCAIFKQTSPNIQWYYRALLPYVHFIPVNIDLSDLLEKISWAKANDSEVQKISENANSFAKANLMHSDVMYYVYLLLCSYAEIQR